jgi:hypothetical protein
VKKPKGKRQYSIVARRLFNAGTLARIDKSQANKCHDDGGGDQQEFNLEREEYAEQGENDKVSGRA